jgi:fibronectin-binding autotransporter adhesin
MYGKLRIQTTAPDGLALATTILIGAIAIPSANAQIPNYVWATGGVYAPSDGPSDLAADLTLEITNGGAYGTYGFDTEEGSTVLWTGGNLGFVYSENGSVENSGTWNANSTSALVLSGLEGGTFTNNGTLENTGSGSLEIFQLPFANTEGATISAAVGSTLIFANETADPTVTTFADGSNFTGGGTITMNGATFSGDVNVEDGTTLIFNQGHFVAAGDDGATLNGDANWVGNSSIGSVFTGTWTVAEGSTLRITGSGVTFDGTDGGTFTNNGTLLVASTGYVNASNGVSVINNGSFIATAATSLNGSTFYNNGLFSDDGGGTVTVNGGGTLTFANNSGGTINAQNATDIIYFAGFGTGTKSSITFDDGSNYTGLGTISIGYQGAAFAGDQNISAGTHMVFASGTFYGDDAVLNGNATWTGGSYFAGTWTLPAGSTLTQTGAAGIGVFGGTNDGEFTNDGTINWATAQNAQVENGEVVTNNGNFIITGAMALVGGGTEGTFINNGLFSNAGGGTVTVVANTLFSFENDNPSGISTAGSVNPGTINVQNATDMIVFQSADSSEVSFGNQTNFTGLGTIKIQGGGATFEGAQNVSSTTTLILSAGTYFGAGTNGATLNGNANMTSGTFEGNWTIAPGSVVTAAAGTFNGSGAGIFYNNGTINWTSASGIVMDNEATVRNFGIFDVSNNASFFDGGGGGIFQNYGLFEKTGGISITSIAASTDFNFVNEVTGTVKVMSGTIALGSSFTNIGTLGGTGTFTGNVTNNGHLFPGDAPGTLTLTGNYLQGSSGFLDIGLSNAGSGFLKISGTATLGGTLDITCFASCTYSKGTEIGFISASSISGTFAHIVQSGFTGSNDFSLLQVGNGYDIVLDNSVAAAVPEPNTLALLFAGGGVLLVMARRQSPAG